MRWQLITYSSLAVAGAAMCISFSMNTSAHSAQSASDGGNVSRTSATNSAAALAASPTYTVAGAAQGAGSANVLFYEDGVIGQSAYLDALDMLGWSYTFTSDPATFATELSASGYTHVIAAQQSSGTVQGWETPLLDWIANNPGRTVLISDWRTGDPAGYLAALGFSYGTANPNVLVPKSGPCFDGLSAVDLANTGWGIYSYVTLGGTPIANTSAGEPIIARNGNIFFNGFLSDVIADPAIAVEYVTQELLKCALPGSACCVKGNCGMVSREACLAFGGEYYEGLTCLEIDCEKCEGDLNGDGVVNTEDLFILLANWGPCQQECTEGFVCEPPFENYPCGDDPDDCVCFNDFDGGISCGLHGSCDVSCPTGACPAGMICAVDTCCGVPTCVAACPSASADTPHVAPARPGEATTARPAASTTQ